MMPKYWKEVTGRDIQTWHSLSKNEREVERESMKSWCQTRGKRKLPKYWIESGKDEYDFRKLTDNEQDEAIFYHKQEQHDNAHISSSVEPNMENEVVDGMIDLIRSNHNQHYKSQNHDNINHNMDIIRQDRVMSTNINESSDEENALEQRDQDHDNDLIVSSSTSKKRGRPSKHEPLKIYTKPSELASTRSRSIMTNLSTAVARRSTQVSGVSIDINGSAQQCSSVMMLELSNLKCSHYLGGSFTSKFVREKPVLRIIGGENKEQVKNFLSQCLLSLSSPDDENFEHVFLHNEEDVKEYYRLEDEGRKAEGKLALEAKATTQLLLGSGSDMSFA